MPMVPKKSNLLLTVAMLVSSILACSKHGDYSPKADYEFGTYKTKLTPELLDWFQMAGYYGFTSRTPFDNAGDKWLHYMFSTYGDALKHFSPDELAVLRSLTSLEGEKLVSKALAPKYYERHPGAIAFNDARFAAELNLAALLEGKSQLAKELLDFSSFDASTIKLEGPYIFPVNIFQELNRAGEIKGSIKTVLPVILEDKFSYQGIRFGNQGVLKVSFDQASLTRLSGTNGAINLAPFSATPGSKQLMLLSGWNFDIKSETIESKIFSASNKKIRSYSVEANLLSYDEPYATSGCH
jgi:hypothetical protein